MRESSQINSMFYGTHMKNYCLKIIVCARCSKKFGSEALFFPRFFFSLIQQEFLQSELKGCMRSDRLLERSLNALLYRLTPSLFNYTLCFHERCSDGNAKKCLKMKLVLFSTQNKVLIQQTLVCVSLYMWIFPVNSQG